MILRKVKVKAFGQENSNLPAISVTVSNNQAICCKDQSGN